MKNINNLIVDSILLIIEVVVMLNRANIKY
jgi:hypothetical protein